MNWIVWLKRKNENYDGRQSSCVRAAGHLSGIGSVADHQRGRVIGRRRALEFDREADAEMLRPRAG